MTSQLAEIGAGSLRAVGRARVMTGYQFLVEQALGQDICSWAQERLDAGMSLRGVAKEMSAALGYPPDIKMSHALLTKWCPGLRRRDR